MEAAAAAQLAQGDVHILGQGVLQEPEDAEERRLAGPVCADDDPHPRQVAHLRVHERAEILEADGLDVHGKRSGLIQPGVACACVFYPQVRRSARDDSVPAREDSPPALRNSTGPSVAESR